MKITIIETKEVYIKAGWQFNLEVNNRPLVMAHMSTDDSEFPGNNEDRIDPVDEDSQKLWDSLSADEQDEVEKFIKSH